MKTQIKVISLLSVLATAFSANAVQRDITVTADIDPTVDVTLADGSPLPSSIAMQYLPGKKVWPPIENRSNSGPIPRTAHSTSAWQAHPRSRI